MEERVLISGQLEYTGQTQRRLVLVLDCLVAHDFNDRYADLMNLQHYVIKEKKLTEKEGIVVALDIVRIVESLHNVSTHWTLYELLKVSTMLVATGHWRIV